MKVPLVAVFFAIASTSLLAADTPKSAPAKVGPEVIVIANQVVDQQWPATLALVNAPVPMDHVEPGQCVRFGVIASGDGHDRLFATAKIELQLESAGKTLSFAAENPAVVKQAKPQGGDTVTQALRAANVENPMLNMASIAVASAKWCAARDTADSSLAIAGSVLLPDGKSVPLQPRTLPVMTFATARQKFPLDAQHVERWMQGYYEAPAPSRILPAMRAIAANQFARDVATLQVFFVEVLRNDPAAADELKSALPGEPRDVRIYYATALLLAGVPIDALMERLSADERADITSSRLADPYDVTPDRNLGSRMDLLWAVFFATGQRKPVETIAAMLAWRPQYDALQKVLATGEAPDEITPDLMRGACYSAAGWGLNTMSLSNPLVGDYIEAIQASPHAPASVRNELATLSTNPAFQQRK